MIHDDVRRGISLTARGVAISADVVELLADTISKQAIHHSDGRQALALHGESGKIVYFSLLQAVTAAAGVLGTILSVGAPLALPAVLCAVGALGGLSGVTETLSEASARIVLLLLEREHRAMPHQELRHAFRAGYDGPQNAMDADFEDGLSKLQSVKGVQLERGTVRLVDRVVIRL